MGNGVLYIAMGDDFISEALSSAKILKRNTSGLPVCLISHQDVSSPVIDQNLVVDDPVYGFADQILHSGKSPFDRTLYLDTDIYVADQIPELFEILDEFDIAAAHVPHWDVREGLELPTVPTSFPEYNTGVLAYRNSTRVHRLFDRWEREFYDGTYPEYDEDQLSFRKVLYNSDVRIATLPPEYNCRYQFPGHVARDVKIFHGRLEDIDTSGVPYRLDIDRIVEQVNAPDDPRVFTQRGGRGPPDRGLNVHTNEGTIIDKFRASVHRNGFRVTLRKMASRAADFLRGKQPD